MPKTTTSLPVSPGALIAHGQQLVELLAKAADYIQEFIECAGGCDHSVGICACEDYAFLAELRDMHQHVTDPAAWMERHLRERREQLQIDAMMETIEGGDS